MTKDYYKILGVTEFETAENIKFAYRKLARKWHPDIAGNTQSVLEKFKEINEAYEILSDKIKKEDYDRARRFYSYAAGNSNTEAETKKTETCADNPQKKKFSFNWEEFISKKQRESSFKKEEKVSPKRGDDINTDIEISVLEAVSGCTKTINMLQTQVCPYCGGRKFANGTLCSHCKGKGEKTDYKKFTVKIPAGVKNGSKIRLSGEGGIGKNGGAKGDLYINICITKPENYNTEGLNILKSVAIYPHEAILGTEIKINTINGLVAFKVAPNTQNGQKIRLAGCGIVQNNKIGDMIVTLEIRIPKSLTNEEINLYKKLGELASKNNRDNQYERESTN